MPPVDLAELLPEGLQIDTFQGSAWLGIMPFWMDRVRLRGLPVIPGMNMLPELSLRTYVREQRSGAPGVYAFSLEVGNPLMAFLGSWGRRLPFHWADVRLDYGSGREIAFLSRRRLTAAPATFQVRYRGLGPTQKTAENRSGTLEHFLLERSLLYMCNSSGHVLRSNLHTVSWPLETAEALIEENTMPQTLGLTLPSQPTSLHYLRRMALYIWPTERVRPRVAAQPIRVAVTPS